MKKLIFILAISAFGSLVSATSGQGEPDAGYPAVSSWLKEQKIELDADPVQAAIEKAHLNNIRSAFIQYGIPSAEYVAVLNDVVVGFYKEMPKPSTHRTSALWGMRNVILKHLTLLVQRPRAALNDSRLPAVDQWLKENQIEVGGTSDAGHWELAILHNLRVLALIYEFPKESYRAMLDDCFLPVFKALKPGADRATALRTVHFVLIMNDDIFTPKKGPNGMK